MLNAGHRRGATIPRCVGPSHTVTEFPVFAAVAMAGLGDLPDTLYSRSVIIRMRRRLPSEEIEPYRRRLHEPEGHRAARSAGPVGDSVSGVVAEAFPEMPAGSPTDRPMYGSHFSRLPMLLVVTGRKRHALPAAARAGGKSREASLGVRLLADLRTSRATAGPTCGQAPGIEGRALEVLHG